MYFDDMEKHKCTKTTISGTRLHVISKICKRALHTNPINNERTTAYVKTLCVATQAKREQVIPRDHIGYQIDHGCGWVSDYASEF